jgi:2-hydroxy-3-keto-5-methylthiopentenyl-1-phosphate phosphatase
MEENKKLKDQYLTDDIVKKIGLMHCDGLCDLSFRSEITKLMSRYNVNGMDAIRAKLILCNLNDALQTLDMLGNGELIDNVYKDIVDKLSAKLIDVLNLKGYITNNELYDMYMDRLLSMDFEEGFKTFLIENREYGIVSTLCEDISYKDIDPYELRKLFDREELTPDSLNKLMKG